jgi:integrase
MARITAISSLRWEQMNIEERIFENVLEKEGKLVTLYFNTECRDLIEKLREYRKENDIEDYGWVFHVGTVKTKPISTNTLNAWAHKIGEMIGVSELHPHDFRHSGATLLKNAGMNLEDVSTLLNHASTDVTKKFYIKEDARKIRSLKDKYEI